MLSPSHCDIVLLARGLEVRTFSLTVRALDSYARGREFKPWCRQSAWPMLKYLGGSRKFPDQIVGERKKLFGLLDILCTLDKYYIHVCKCKGTE